MNTFLDGRSPKQLLVIAVLALTLVHIGGCATTTPRERAEKECANSSSKESCLATVWRREVVYDQCHSQGNSRFRQYTVADGQQCRTTRTVSGSVYTGNTNCAPTYKTCNDLRAMEDAFAQCVAGTDQSVGELSYRYRVSLSFFQAANNVNNCPR
jgi:hypothetical protein